MSKRATAPDHIPAAAFELREAPASPAFVGEDGSVQIHVIRPGVGKGRGNHLYEARMLQENAGVFKGWKMYIDHLAPEARKAAGGLPRTWKDYGGRVQEAWWDPTVPADPDNGWEQGAVVARVKPFGLVQEIIEHDPEVMEASISATATGVKPSQKDGKRVWLVEGIEPKGSVDWVTEAGAGGRVVSLMESLFNKELESTMDLLEAMTDDQVREYLEENRPQLLEAAAPPEPVATGAMSDEQITGLLQRPEVQDFLRGMTEAAVEDALAEQAPRIVAETRQHSDRTVRVRELRDEAHDLIAESKLHPALQDELKRRYEIQENGEPTAALDVVAELEDGKVIKTDLDVLRESVEEDIAHQRKLAESLSPTRVRGQGAQTTDPEKRERSLAGSFAGQFLQEAGVDPDKAYGLKLED